MKNHDTVLSEFREIANKFSNNQIDKWAEGFLMPCPVHPDSGKSLCVKISNYNISLYCQSQCDQSRIIKMIGNLGGSPDLQQRLIQPEGITSFLAKKLPFDEPIMGNWLYRKSSVLIAAETGKGKSLFAYTIALALASGGEAFDWSVKKPLNVGVFDSEMSEKDIHERMKRIEEFLKKDTTHLKFIMREHYDRIPLPFPDLSDSKQAEQILDKFEHCQVILIDNINSSFSGKDENSFEFWIGIQNFVLMCKSRNITCILVHHCPKSTPNAPAGNSKAERIFEKVIVLSKNDNSDKNTGASFNVKFRKNRNFSEDTGDFSLRLTTDINGFYCWEKTNSIPSKADKKLVSSIAVTKQIVDLKNEGKSLREIESITNVSRSTIQRELKSFECISRNSS